MTKLSESLSLPAWNMILHFLMSVFFIQWVLLSIWQPSTWFWLAIIFFILIPVTLSCSFLGSNTRKIYSNFDMYRISVLNSHNRLLTKRFTLGKKWIQPWQLYLGSKLGCIDKIESGKKWLSRPCWKTVRPLECFTHYKTKPLSQKQVLHEYCICSYCGLLHYFYWLICMLSDYFL